MPKKPLHILHLEDSEVDAELVQLALEKSDLDHHISVTRTRQQYLAALDSGGFDLILSDSGIPGYDGVSALEAAHQHYPEIPFIFVSGNGNKQVPEDLLTMHSIEHVSKTDVEKLASTIQRILQTKTISNHQILPDATHSVTDRLINVVQELSLARDLTTVMEIVRHAARELTGADGATFVLRDDEQCYYAEENAISPLWKGKRFPMSACISGWVMLNKKTAVIEDIYSDPRIPVDAYRPTFVKSMAMVPIRTLNPVGAIGNYWASHHKATAEELKLLQALANSTSIAMENVQLYSELEKRVQDRTMQLEATNRELEAFCYSVSHDLRAPLRHIDSFSQLLSRNLSGQLDDTGEKYIERIHVAINNMNTLIDDLLALSRVTLAEMNRTSVDLTTMAREITHELQQEPLQRQVEFLIDDGVSADGDPRLLHVVLQNLLSNAWKYTSREPHAQIKFGCRQDDQGQTLYYVHDNGAGFDMTYIDKLFDPFQRLHSDSEFPGTGVGLAIVERIIHKHGGRIRAESDPENGTTFFFTLTP